LLKAGYSTWIKKNALKLAILIFEALLVRIRCLLEIILYMTKKALIYLVLNQLFSTGEWFVLEQFLK
jgi:hypothetical protein